MTMRKYDYLSGYGKLDDSTVTFGTKVLHDQYDEPYDAYYSQYNEEGTYTVDPKDYKNGGADYLYKVVDDPSAARNSMTEYWPYPWKITTRRRATPSAYMSRRNGRPWTSISRES